MKFEIKGINSGYFRWYLIDEEKRLEFNASYLAEKDFIREFVNALSDIIKGEKEHKVEIDFETGGIVLELKRENEFFSIKISTERQDNSDTKEVLFEDTMYAMRTEFVHSIRQAFVVYETNQIKFEEYNENWIPPFTNAKKKWGFPEKELYNLYSVASSMQY